MNELERQQVINDRLKQIASRGKRYRMLNCEKGEEEKTAEDLARDLISQFSTDKVRLHYAKTTHPDPVGEGHMQINIHTEGPIVGEEIGIPTPAQIDYKKGSGKVSIQGYL